MLGPQPIELIDTGTAKSRWPGLCAMAVERWTMVDAHSVPEKYANVVLLTASAPYALW